MPTGVYIRTKEHNRKISEALTGKHLSEKTKKKLSEFQKQLPNPTRFQKGHSCWKGRHHSEETKRKMSELYRGNKRYNWRGGITSVRQRIRKCQKYQEWRQRVFIRDDFICQKCKQYGEDLEAHHIKSFKILLEEVKKYLPLYPLYEGAMIYTPFWDINNGITLCVKCHNKTKKNLTS